MGSILEDKTKFLNMSGVHLHDNTAKNEQKLQKRLLDLANQNILARDVYDRVRPTGSQRPRMYGLPKTQKEDIPLRPILSMIGSSQHELAKWLAEILAGIPTDGLTKGPYRKTMKKKNPSPILRRTNFTLS